MKSSENSASSVANHVRDKNVVDDCIRPDGCVPPPVCPPNTVCYPLWGRHECRSVSASNSKRWFNYDIPPSTTAVFSYVIGSRKLSANEQFFVGAQTVVSLLQTTQIISNVCFMLLTPAQINQNRLNRDGAKHFTCVLGR